MNTSHNPPNDLPLNSPVDLPEGFSNSFPTDFPRAAQPFVRFVTILRTHGFAVAPEQTQLFINAVGLLGPRSMSQIYFAAHATLAPPPDRRDEFDALYRLIFLGHSLSAPSSEQSDREDEMRSFDERDGAMEPPVADEINEVGEQATGAENLTVREFINVTESDALRQFRRIAPAALPRRKTYRRRQAFCGNRWDIRRTLRDAVKRDGEILNIPRLRRKTRQRRIVLAIDISGSMKAQTESYMRFAHALCACTEQVEVFTLGTRLTRVSRALRTKHVDMAMATASSLVADWDGGTRLGDALDAFLNIPRFAGFTRGALVVILSDGLERGDHSTLTGAVDRLSRLAWQVQWLTPLASDTQFVPQTDALKSLVPFLNGLGNGASVSSVCQHLLSLTRDQPVPTQGLARYRASRHGQTQNPLPEHTRDRSDRMVQ